ncbi:MAG TPA: hypothetical protein VGC60_09070, partial [Pyrinomonadaceae bacterium]
PSPAMSAKRETVYDIKKCEIERAAGEGARAPSTNWLVPDRIDFFGKAGFGDLKIELRAKSK